MDLKLVSEDERRKLLEFGEGGEWKVCKILEVKEESWVGKHFHKKKDEMFVLLSGSGTFIVGPDTDVRFAPFCVFIKRNTYHAFKLSKGSVLLGLCSELHDPEDDYKV